MSFKDDYLEHARTEMLPKMKGSSLSIAIYGGEPDIKLCLEIGAAVLYDKPLIVVVPADKQIPANLKRLASVIVQGDTNDQQTKEALRRAIDNVIANDARCKARNYKPGGS